MSTKVQSYEATKSQSGSSRERVKQALVRGPLSRSEIAEVTGLRVSSVCGRVNELLKSGEVAVYGLKWDEATQRSVETVGLASLTPREAMVLALRGEGSR